MAQTRKDLRGRVLRTGESQRRSDWRYVYTYTDPLGRRKKIRWTVWIFMLPVKQGEIYRDF